MFERMLRIFDKRGGLLNIAFVDSLIGILGRGV